MTVLMRDSAEAKHFAKTICPEDTNAVSFEWPRVDSRIQIMDRDLRIAVEQPQVASAAHWQYGQRACVYWGATSRESYFFAAEKPIKATSAKAMIPPRIKLPSFSAIRFPDASNNLV